MLPTNVMSFMKKMVATEPGSASSATDIEGGMTFEKLKQTLSSSLLTAQDKVTKMSPRPSLIPDVDALSPTEDKSEQQPTTPPVTTKPETEKTQNRAGNCRVCLKAFKMDDSHRSCAECNQRVCEDCASYSKQAENDSLSSWTCSVCRRKMQSRTNLAQISKESNESLLEIPIQELQRRHSETRLGSNEGGGLTIGSVGSGLAPPRSPELRRHSDVSPSSLKELEKLKASGGSKPVEQDRRHSKGVMEITQTSAPRELPNNQVPVPLRSRRASRVARQRSYDEDVKAGGKAGGDSGLILPPPMPRRASAYDVFSGAPALGVREGSRRASMRVSPPENNSPSGPENDSCLLTAVEDKKMQRRGSRIADMLGALPPRPIPNLEDLEAVPRRQASVDAEAIRIVIHDVDSGSTAGVQKRVVLKKDPTDKTHRTRGFGMRVVGGKTAPDGRLFAYIVWTVPCGPAEKGGLQQGDKVLEWDGVSLIDRSFEEVCAIMDRTGETVELLVEHATDLRICDLLDDPIPMSNYASGRKMSDIGPSSLQVDQESENGPASPTRRKLPKTPVNNIASSTSSTECVTREMGITGRIQIQVWYHDERKELVVAVLAADDLAPRDENQGFGCLPEAYARLCLMPMMTDEYCVQTEVAPASRNPIWNANLSFPGISGDDLNDRVLEISLWDLIPHNDHAFLGECSVDLHKAFLDDRAIWCRLEDSRQSHGKSPHTSPRGSLAGTEKRGDFGNQRSVSDDVDSIGECASLLHPDRAWGSRRGSSQSEQLEVEVYELGKDFSRSLPGSRRSSFQSVQEQLDEDKPAAPPPPSYSRDRRRSSCTRMLRDPEEILKSLKAVKGELGRTMSLTGDKRHRKSMSGSTDGRKEEIAEITESTKEVSSPSSSPERTSPPQLGPGQIKPKGFRLCSSHPVELKLGLMMTKGQLEVEVVCARRIPARETPPDTYVKCYLREGERWLQKKKTRIMKHSYEPQFRQTLRYQACDVLGRSLVVMLWERQGGFEHNQGLGGAEVALDTITLTHLTTGWYPLFPINSLGSDSNDSP